MKLRDGRLDKAINLAVVVVPSASLLIMCAIGAASAMAGWSALRFGLDPFRLLNTVHTVSAAKIILYWKLAWQLAVISVVICFAALLKGLYLRAAIGFVFSAAILSPVLALETSLHPSVTRIIERFEWQEVDVDFDLTTWEPRGTLRASLNSFDELRQAAYAAYSPEVDSILRPFISDSIVRRATFLTAIVSHLWGPGNRFSRSTVGCVRQNEETNNVAVPEQASTFALYRDATIACCDDFSHLLKLLLDGDGIPNRLVMSAGHAFNEATIGGRGYVLDAMNAVTINASWYAVNRRSENAIIQALPFGAARPTSSLFRPTAAIERQRLVMLLLLGGHQTRYINLLPQFITTGTALSSDLRSVSK